MMELSQRISGGGTALADNSETAVSANDEFSALVRRQSRLVFRVAYSVLRNTHDSEDVAQETFLKLYRSGAWKNIRDEQAFLARTAWRIAIDRRPRMRAATNETDAPSPCKTPEQMASLSNWIAHVHKLIDALPRDLREPLVLATVEELNSNQIGQILGVPDGTVRTRLQRARQVLKAKLATQMGGPRGI
ncbi:MAG: RNA polymerase sigma factor [Bryobacteraceae bacterium]